jgi:hypothetical protein
MGLPIIPWMMAPPKSTGCFVVIGIDAAVLALVVVDDLVSDGAAPLVDMDVDSDVRVKDAVDDPGIFAGYSPPSSIISPFKRPPTRDLASTIRTSYPR